MNLPNSAETMNQVSTSLSNHLGLPPSEGTEFSEAVAGAMKEHSPAVADYKVKFADALVRINAIGVGRRTAEQLVKTFVTVDRLLTASVDVLTSLWFMEQSIGYNLFVTLQEPDAKMMLFPLKAHPGASLQDKCPLDGDEYGIKVVFMGHHSPETLKIAKAALKAKGGMVTTFLNRQTSIVVLDGRVPKHYQRKKKILEGVQWRALTAREKEMEKDGKKDGFKITSWGHPLEGTGKYKTMNMAMFLERLGLPPTMRPSTAA